MTHDLRLITHEKYMQRCLGLARHGASNVAPNPMVGAILVHDGKIIGEGYHRLYGGPHAEVNCINSVKPEDKEKISQSVLYVSLEPCCHFGKTPPCTDLIIANKIPEVVIGYRDPNKKVGGKGIEKLKAAGVKVVYGILEDECRQINKRFIAFHTHHRPYVILKWAETADGFISTSPKPYPKERASEPSVAQRLIISNENTNRLVHKWRSEEVSIFIGTNTALLDDPELTTRYWTGSSPIRLVIDLDLKLPLALKIFNGNQRTVIFNTVKQEEKGNLVYCKVNKDINLVHQVLNALYQMKILSVLVEGGARLLQSFIDEGLWDEARIICNRQLVIGKGLPSPELESAELIEEIRIGSDEIKYFQNKK